MITAARYHSPDAPLWNKFLEESANGTFVLDRRYMDYHKDRFVDHSLLLYREQEPIAVFPASELKKRISSHPGLTYGGLIIKPKTDLLTVLSCFYTLTKYYHAKGFTALSYKPVPEFFHTEPQYGDRYALFRLSAHLKAMNTGFALPMQGRPVISKRRLRQVRKAIQSGIRVSKARDCVNFWEQILTPHLAAKFNTKPVHTLQEIELLRKRFPTKILQYNALKDRTVVAGVTIFWDRGVAHSQYIASGDLGRQTGALDYLFWHLMTKEFKKARFFSFGTTNMGSVDGRALSRGLVEWKEGFGTTMFPYPSYDIETKNYNALRQYK